MLGGTLALLNHSLQLDARLLRHHIYRLIFVGILYVAILFLTVSDVAFGAPGRWLFTTFAYLNFWFISLAGISFFATAISEEKEEETLGILRMAGMSPTSLLLGKSTSRLLVTGLLLSLQFPFSFLAITLGGVTTLQVQAVFLTLLAYTILVANLGLLCSIISRRASRAAFLMTVFLGSFLYLPPVIKWIATQFSGGTAATGVVAGLVKVADRAIEMSALNRISEIMASNFAGPRLSFQITSNVIAALALFVISRIIFDRVTRYHSAPSAGRGLLIRPKRWFRFLGTGRTWATALIWKDFHFIAGGKPLIIIKFVAYGLIVALIAALAFVGGSDSILPASLSTIGMMCLILFIECTILASRMFREEVQLNALSALMLLPTKPHNIAYAKFCGCLLSLVPALTYLTLGVIGVIAASIIEPDADAIIGSIMFLLIGGGTLVCTAIFFLHLVAYLSMIVKWGAIPLSIGVTLLTNVLMVCLIFLGIAPFLYIAAAVGLHFLIGIRFRQLGMQ